MNARVFAGLFALVATSAAFGQSGPTAMDVERIIGRFDRVQGDAVIVFTAKFVCGKATLNEVAPGRYFTAINIHNTTDYFIHGAVLTVGLTNGTKAVVGPVPLSAPRGHGGLEVDCTEIAAVLKDQSGNLLKGFAEIRVPVDLDLARLIRQSGIEDFRDVFDVFVVYTASGL